MKAVIFTRHYPYANEPFLEEELRVLENRFSEILLVTYAKNGELLNGYIPENARIIHLRKGEPEIFHTVKAILTIFSIRFWKEFINGCKERGITKFVSIAKKILLYERRMAAIERKRGEWLGEEKNKNILLYSYWLNPAATYLARNKNNLPGICISRTHGEDCFFSRSYVPWRENTLKNLDAVFPISESGKKDIIDHYSSKIVGLEKKVTVFKLGVVVPPLLLEKESQDSVKIVASCSNIIALKRLDLIIDALALVDDTPIRWIHFGDGPLQDEIVERAQRKLGSKTNISYEFMGRVAKDEILAYYNYNPVNLFVNCSDVEGIPVSIMEAMSYGIPAIARNVGGISEIIDDSCGLLLPERISPMDLKEGIIQILTGNKNMYREICKNARTKILSEYDCKKNYLRFCEHIKGMISENAVEQY